MEKNNFQRRQHLELLRSRGKWILFDVGPEIKPKGEMIMLRTERKTEARTRRIVARGGAVGLSVTAVLIGVSLVILSLRKTRVNLEIKRED